MSATVAVDPVEGVLEVVRAAGGRVTSPRRAIVQALVRHRGHPTAEQITAAVRRHQPDVNESTVYRFLDELERLGVVDHVHLGHGPAVYHFAADEHLHLVCQGCGSVTEVPPGAVASLRRKLVGEFGFHIDPRHFAVPGRCEACARL